MVVVLLLLLLPFPKVVQYKYCAVRYVVRTTFEQCTRYAADYC